MVSTITDQYAEGKIGVAGADMFSKHGTAVFPRALFQVDSVSSGAKILYTLLCDYSWHNPSAALSHEKLAREIGVSVRSARTYAAELCAAGFLEILPRPGRPSLYKISAHL